MSIISFLLVLIYLVLIHLFFPSLLVCNSAYLYWPDTHIIVIIASDGILIFITICSSAISFLVLFVCGGSFSWKAFVRIEWSQKGNRIC
jgi:hypothetical protein